METEKDRLTLKWGTVKGWTFQTVHCEAFRLLQEFLKDSTFSCMSDRPGEDRRKLLCRAIDAFDGEIYLDWDGKYVDREEAKKYVMNYGKTPTN